MIHIANRARNPELSCHAEIATSDHVSHSACSTALATLVTVAALAALAALVVQACSSVAGVRVTLSPHPQAEVWFGFLKTNPERSFVTS